jgi:hypothetical protein
MTTSNELQMEINEEIRYCDHHGAILVCECHLKILNQNENLPMITKIREMITLVDELMRYTKDETISMNSITNLIHEMTFLQANCEVQTLPMLDDRGRINGLPDNWYGNVDSGLIHIVTDYANTEISIDIVIRTGKTQISIKSIIPTIHIPVTVCIIGRTYTDWTDCPYRIDMFTSIEHTKIVRNLFVNNTPRMIDEIRRLCDGRESVYMKYESLSRKYRIHLTKDDDLHYTLDTFDTLDTVPGILFSIANEDGNRICFGWERPFK